MTLSPESSDDLLRAGVAALRAGDRALATSLLARAVRSDPRSERAWLFLAGAVTDPDQRRSCLERVLALNPQNEAAREGLRGLAPSPAPAPPPAPAAPEPAPAAPATAAALTIPLPAQAPPPARPAPATAEQVMSLLSAAPAEPDPPPPPPPAAPEPATSVTTRLTPAMVALDVEPPAAARRPPDRLVWSLVLALGLLLMLGSAAYAVILLRG